MPGTSAAYLNGTSSGFQARGKVAGPPFRFERPMVGSCPSCQYWGVFAVFRRSAPRRPTRALGGAAILGALLAVGLPGTPARAAEGPGYGGTADSLTVQWRTSGRARSLAVYAVGFRGGSPVLLRVGAAAERTVRADPTGAVRVLVVGAGGPPVAPPVGMVLMSLDQAATGLSAGVSVQALGQTRGLSTRSLVGAVPPRPTGHGPQDLVPWLAAGGVLAFAVGVLRRRPDRSAAPRGRHAGRPGRHRAPRPTLVTAFAQA
jgi:hypothetical protein